MVSCACCHKTILHVKRKINNTEVCTGCFVKQKRKLFPNRRSFLISEIFRYYDEIGETPKLKRIRNRYSSYPKEEEFIEEFGGFWKALKYVGLRI